MSLRQFVGPTHIQRPILVNRGTRHDGSRQPANEISDGARDGHGVPAGTLIRGDRESALDDSRGISSRPLQSGVNVRRSANSFGCAEALEERHRSHVAPARDPAELSQARLRGSSQFPTPAPEIGGNRDRSDDETVVQGTENSGVVPRTYCRPPALSNGGCPVRAMHRKLM